MKFLTLKIKKTESWSTDLPVLKIGSFNLWDFGALNTNNGILKMWVITFLGKRYSLTYFK